MGLDMLFTDSYLEWYSVRPTIHQSEIAPGPVPTKTSTRGSKRQTGAVTMSKTEKPLHQNRRGSRSSDEAKGRQRGRPRLASNGETASEVRPDQLQIGEQLWLETICSVDGSKSAMRNEVGLVCSSYTSSSYDVYTNMVEELTFLSHALCAFVSFHNTKADPRLWTAYRQRKETTIEELSDRVAGHERTILEMNRTFVAFNNSAANSALPSIEPVLAHNLQTVALRFSTLASSSTSDRTLDSVEEVQTTSPRAYQKGRKIDIAMKSETQMAEATDYQLHAPLDTSGPASSPWGYSFDAAPMNVQRGHVERVTRDVPMNDFTYQPGSMDTPPPVWTDQPLVDFPVTVNEAQNLAPLSNTVLAPPSTHSFRETTFARRLLRASYERTCRVMSNPERNAATIENMSRFTLCFSNSANIQKWANKMASATTEDSLEHWVAPQLHLGNAGLHYPRTSLDGANPPPPFWANKAPMGPRISAIAETPVPDSMTVEEIVEMVGFQGEWFDPNDVEHYLKSKGLVLDEHSSWAELNSDAVPSLEAAVTSAIGSSASSSPSTDPSSAKDADSMLPEVSVLRGGGQLRSVAVKNIVDYAARDDTQVHENAFDEYTVFQR